jgi:hypothetical protein
MAQNDVINTRKQFQDDLEILKATLVALGESASEFKFIPFDAIEIKMREKPESPRIWQELRLEHNVVEKEPGVQADGTAPSAFTQQVVEKGGILLYVTISNRTLVMAANKEISLGGNPKTMLFYYLEFNRDDKNDVADKAVRGILDAFLKSMSEKYSEIQK